MRTRTDPSERKRAFRRKSLRSQRGAVMVETAMMFPMFIILFYGSIYAHNLGYAYIKVNQESRAAAWTYAMANCGDKGNVSDDSEVLPPLNSNGGSGQATKLSPMPDNPTKQAVPGGGLVGSASSIIGTVGSKFAGALGHIFPEPNGSQSVNKQALSWRLPNLYNGTGMGVLGVGGTNTTNITQSVTVDCNNAVNDGGAVKSVELLGMSIFSFLKPP